MSNNDQVKRKILNALSDLDYTQRHNDHMTLDQSAAVDDAIARLESEYIALAGRAPDGAYDAVNSSLNSAQTSLTKIRDERVELATQYVSAAKILGSVSRILALIP